MNDDTRVMFDLETGGIQIGRSAIIQIAAIAFDARTFDIGEQFERKIKFRVGDADPKALEMNSYNPETWEKEAIHPRQAMRETLAFLNRHAREWVSAKGKNYKAASLVGHNIVRFDWPFFEAWCNALGKSWLPIHNPPLDTVQVAITVEEITGVKFDNRKLETLAKYYGVGEPQTHDAFDDVLLNIQVLKCLFADLKGDVKPNE